MAGTSPAMTAGGLSPKREGAALPALNPAFDGRARMDGQRVHAGGELIRKNRVDHAMAFDPGLTFERLRHDIEPEVSLPAGLMPGMAFVSVRFVLDLKALRRKSLGQLPGDEIGCLHGLALKWRRSAGQCPRCG